MADELKNSNTTRRAYTLEFKLGVLEWMKKNDGSTRGTARRFGIHRRMIQKWKENESELTQAFGAKGGRRMKIHQQKQPLFQELEERMSIWFIGQNQLSDNDIRTCALTIAREIGLVNFKASSAWILSFKERHSASGYNTSGTLLTNNSQRISPPTGEALLAHTKSTEPIRLQFTEGIASMHSLSSSERFIYYDYQTPEHNYCKMAPIPAKRYSDKHRIMDDKGLRDDILLTDGGDNDQVVLGHEETIGIVPSDDIEIVISTNTNSLEGIILRDHRDSILRDHHDSILHDHRDSILHDHRDSILRDHRDSISFPTPLDINNGVLTIATRTYQPEFSIEPELVLFGQQ